VRGGLERRGQHRLHSADPSSDLLLRLLNSIKRVFPHARLPCHPRLRRSKGVLEYWKKRTAGSLLLPYSHTPLLPYSRSAPGTARKPELPSGLRKQLCAPT